MKWYNDRTLLVNFHNALIDAGVIEDTDDSKIFFSRPFRYDDAFDTWREYGFPMEDDENWEEFVSAVTDEEEDNGPDDEEEEDENEEEEEDEEEEEEDESK